MKHGFCFLENVEKIMRILKTSEKYQKNHVDLKISRSMHPHEGISIMGCQCWFCSTSSRRKPGWRFTAGRDIKMCYMESVLHVLKFRFPEFSISENHKILISIWVQCFAKGHFLGDFLKIFLKNHIFEKKHSIFTFLFIVSKFQKKQFVEK